MFCMRRASRTSHRFRASLLTGFSPKNVPKNWAWKGTVFRPISVIGLVSRLVNSIIDDWEAILKVWLWCIADGVACNWPLLSFDNSQLSKVTRR
jgi:hypothetical protein